MAKNKTQYKICKAYKTNLNELQKDFFKNKEIGLSLFIEYLKYLRDDLIIQNKTGFTSTPEKDLKVTTLNTAIAEYEAYYNLEIFKTNPQLRVLHWNSFWELVKINLNDWMSADDTI